MFRFASAEQITAAELFLSAADSCGVELVQVLAKSAGIPLQGIEIKNPRIDGSFRPVRSDVCYLYQTCRTLNIFQHWITSSTLITAGQFQRAPS
jgi:hypothetical protein